MRSLSTESHIPEIEPDTHAPVENLKHPGLLATTVVERSEPPRIAPGGSNGEDEPKSITKPVSFERLCQVTLVPVFTQNGVFALASATLAIEAAESDVRFTSTMHGVDVDPQVLLVPQILSG